MKVYSMEAGIRGYQWTYWVSPESCYNHFVKLNHLTLETLGDTLCIF